MTFSQTATVIMILPLLRTSLAYCTPPTQNPQISSLLLSVLNPARRTILHHFYFPHAFFGLFTSSFQTVACGNVLWKCQPSSGFLITSGTLFLWLNSTVDLFIWAIVLSLNSVEAALAVKTLWAKIFFFYLVFIVAIFLHFTLRDVLINLV